jgi:25S rRNA (uracil2634-N3)-methyltransferase
VGDGDFTFSCSLAAHLGGDRLTATSHESKDTVCSTYKNAGGALEQLAEKGARTLTGVDATRTPCSLFTSNEHLTFATGLQDVKGLGKFDRIIWNFPCKGRDVRQGADAQLSEIEENKTLLNAFFQSAYAHLLPMGEIHVTHKTKVCDTVPGSIVSSCDFV